MSHELRTPLNAILGFAQLMGRDPDMPDAQLHNLKVVRDSGEHLLSVINDVLDMSKIEAGRMQLDLESEALSAMLQTIGHIIAIRADEKGIAFHLHLDPDLPPFIRTDIRKLRQCLINLLANAVKYTDVGRVSLHVIKAEAPIGERHKDKLLLRFIVQDSGRGIAANELESIFDPFVQVGGSSGNIQGTGLGLAISRQFARLMGGEISVTSTLGEGARFQLDVPVDVAQEEALNESARNARQVVGVEGIEAADWRILVVDDWPTNRLLLRCQLEQVGFSVREAENGRQALDLFDTWKPHLIWMDQRMPEMDGREAIAHLRARPDGREVVIIVLTASAFSEEREEILASGCNDLIQKPYQEHEIFEAISRHLGITFLYEDQAPSQRPGLPAPEAPIQHAERLARLEDGLKKRLHEAAVNLDTDALERAVSEIARYDEALGSALEKLLRNYQYDLIIQMVE